MRLYSKQVLDKAICFVVFFVLPQVASWGKGRCAVFVSFYLKSLTFIQSILSHGSYFIYAPGSCGFEGTLLVIRMEVF